MSCRGQHGIVPQSGLWMAIMTRKKKKEKKPTPPTPQITSVDYAILQRDSMAFKGKTMLMLTSMMTEGYEMLGHVGRDCEKSLERHGANACLGVRGPTIQGLVGTGLTVRAPICSTSRIEILDRTTLQP